MHIIDLTIVPDLAIALLLDWTDNKKFVDESSRQLRLQKLGEDYRSWVGNTSDRANQLRCSNQDRMPSLQYHSISSVQLLPGDCLSGCQRSQATSPQRTQAVRICHAIVELERDFRELT
eukprot:s9552_g2.t1